MLARNVKVVEGGGGGAAGGGSRSSVASELGPDAGVVGLDGGGVDGGEVGVDGGAGGGEGGPVGVGRVVGGVVGPLDVGAEADAAGEVEGEVDAEAWVAGDRGGIDEGGGSGMAAGVGEVGSLGVEGRVLAVVGEDLVGEGDGGEAGCVDERFGRDGGGGGGGWLASAVGGSRGADGPSPFSSLDRRNRRDGRAEGAEPALVFKVALQILHQAVGVEDARRRAFENTGLGANVWLSPVGFGVGEEVGGCADASSKAVDVLEGFPLRRILGDDPFARVAMRDRVLLAELVQQVLAAQAKTCFEGIGPVIEAGMDDLGSISEEEGDGSA